MPLILSLTHTYRQHCYICFCIVLDNGITLEELPQLVKSDDLLSQIVPLLGQRLRLKRHLNIQQHPFVLTNASECYNDSTSETDHAHTCCSCLLCMFFLLQIENDFQALYADKVDLLFDNVWEFII